MISNMDLLKRQTVFRDGQFLKTAFAALTFFVHANRIYDFKGHFKAIPSNAREIV